MACALSSNGASPRRRPRLEVVWQEIKDNIKGAIEFDGQSKLANMQAAMSQGRQLHDMLKSAFSGDRGKDAAGVALDAVTVGVAVIAGLSGIGLVAGIAFGASVAF